MGWASLVLTLSTGWFLANALAPIKNQRKLAAPLRQLALAAFLGPGVVSLLYFALALTGFVSYATTVAMLTSCAAASGLAWVTRRRMKSPPATYSPDLLWKRFLLPVLVIGMAAFLLRFDAVSRSVPEGEYDALSMWNVRGSYLAGGEQTWRRAIGAETEEGFSVSVFHPGYPLYLPAFLAAQWVVTGESDPAISRAASLLFGAAAIGLLGGSLAILRSPTLATLACLVMFASRDFITQSAAQYADIPLGLGILATLVLLDQGAGEDNGRGAQP